jgi:hypothetical protein
MYGNRGISDYSTSGTRGRNSHPAYSSAVVTSYSVYSDADSRDPYVPKDPAELPGDRRSVQRQNIATRTDRTLSDPATRTGRGEPDRGAGRISRSPIVEATRHQDRPERLRGY